LLSSVVPSFPPDCRQWVVGKVRFILKSPSTFSVRRVLSSRPSALIFECPYAISTFLFCLFPPVFKSKEASSARFYFPPPPSQLPPAARCRPRPTTPASTPVHSLSPGRLGLGLSLLGLRKVRKARPPPTCNPPLAFKVAEPAPPSLCTLRTDYVYRAFNFLFCFNRHPPPSLSLCFFARN